MIAAGSLNKRISIEQRGTAVDSIGQPVEAWSQVWSCRASIRYPSGLSTIKAAADVSIVQASIRIRYHDGLNAGMRVVRPGEVFDIKAVLPNRAEGYVDLVCELVK